MKVSMPHRMLLIGRRKDGMSHDDCIEYLEEEHVPLVKKLPGLQRFTTSIPLNPDEMGYDEIEQLWFKTAEDLETATESEEWQRILMDAQNFIDVENTVMITVTDETLRHQTLPENLVWSIDLLY